MVDARLLGPGRTRRAEAETLVKLTDEEREFMRLVFEETSGIPFKPVAITTPPEDFTRAYKRRL